MASRRLQHEFHHDFFPNAKQTDAERQRREAERPLKIVPREPRRYYLVIEVDLWEAGKVPSPESMEIRLAKDDLRRLLETLLRDVKLPQQRREMLRAYLLEGKTIEEIAQELNISMGKTITLLIPMIAKLRRHPKAADLRELLRIVTA